MLDHKVDVSSTPGNGSFFSVTVPLASPQSLDKQASPAVAPGEHSKLDDLAVLCIDNEADILEGMNMLLDRWGCSVMLAENQLQAVEQIRKNGRPGMVLVDYHLSDQSNGLDVMEHLDRVLEAKLPAIVITADRSPELEEKVRSQNYGLLRKPIRPAALRALMTNMLKSLDRE